MIATEHFMSRRADQWSAFSEGCLVAGLATGGSALVGMALGAPQPTGLEAAVAATGFGATWLFVRQLRQAYFWGAVCVALSSVLFWQSGLPGSAAAQVWLMGSLAYGWWRWRSDDDPRPVTRVRPAWWWLVYLAVAAAASWVSLLTASAYGTPFPTADAAIMSLSMLAQFLLDNKKIETWLVWVAVNVLGVYVYWEQGLALVSVQYALFLANTLWGWYCWSHAVLPSVPSVPEPPIRTTP